ncbi:MAG: signal peptidase I [Candidatus Caccosoma sp.]|nr:signal peptidase I [Candidatus Caccosoma sp.]
MKKKNKVVDIIINILLIISIVVCSFLVVFKLTFMKVVVNGNSMNPSINNGTKGYMQKVNANTKIELFDVVAGEYKNNNNYIIKRVLGLPNQEVELVDNVLKINGEVVEQTFTFNKRTGNFNETHWSLNDNEYLLVGDNRGSTIQPVVENKSKIVAKNGFAVAEYDVNSSKCSGSDDYSSCPIRNRSWYFFKQGINN